MDSLYRFGFKDCVNFATSNDPGNHYFGSLRHVRAERRTLAHGLLGAGTANLCRLTLATACLALWAHTFGGGFTGAGLPWLFLSGVVGFGMGDLALYGAYCRLGPRLGVLLCLCLAASLGGLAGMGVAGYTTDALYQILSGADDPGGRVYRAGSDTRAAVTPRVWGIGIVLGAIAALGQGGGGS